MENNYKVFMGVETETKKVFEKHLIAQGYQIIEVDLKEILFAKKSIGTETEEDIETEQVAIRILIGIIKKYLGMGIVFIDFSDVMREIINNLKQNNNKFKIDNRITWRIRQTITRAIIDKNKTGEREYGENHSTN